MPLNSATGKVLRLPRLRLRLNGYGREAFQNLIDALALAATRFAQGLPGSVTDLSRIAANRSLSRLAKRHCSGFFHLG
jgi:hypothetical protein